MRRAVIDIGTNSVKLLVAEVSGESVLPLWEESEQTRLGEGFYESHRLQPGPIAKTSRAVARLAEKGKGWNVDSVRLIATSAVRDAINQRELLDQVRVTSGLPIEVISGEQEAEWAFAGVRSDPALRDKPLFIVDLGGGSMELILGHDTRVDFRHSFALGTVRLLEQIRPADPPLGSDWEKCREWLTGFLREQVAPLLQPHIQAIGTQELVLVGTGGTPSILATMDLGLAVFDRAKIEQARLSLERIRYFQGLLWGLSLDDRKRVPGLPANRADVILFGVAVFLQLMEALRLGQLRVSTRGLRFAAAVSLNPVLP